MAQDRKKYSVWSITAYNQEATDLDLMLKKELDLPDIVRQVWGGLEECPTTGKIHFQGMLKTPSIYMTKLKAIFPTAHLEPAKDKNALEQYVMKEETAVGVKSSVVNDQYVSSKDALLLMAKKVFQCTQLYLKVEGDHKTRAYVMVSRKVVYDNIALGTLYARPDIRRAWIDYWQCYLSHYSDSQLSSSDNEAEVPDDSITRNSE